MYYDFDCPWYSFDNSLRSLLGVCLIILGCFSLLLNGWLFVAFVHSHLLTFRSHLLILQLCCACIGRNVLGGFPMSGSSAVARRWLFGPESCELFGFYNHFFGLLQMTSLTALCLERYLLVRSFWRDKELSLPTYSTILTITWIWTIVLTTPTLSGFAGFSCDTSKTFCTLQWYLEDNRSFGYIFPYLIGGLLIPIFIMFYTICKTVPAEAFFYRSERMKEHRRLTKCIVIISTTTLAFWLPTAVLTAWIAVPPLVRGYSAQPPVLLSFMAALGSEVAPSIPVLCFLIWDPRTRTALLGRVQENYALIRNRSQMPFQASHRFSKL